MAEPRSQDPTYALGHSDRELERLSTQARLAEPITRRLFVEAGIGPGMRVLDVGSGPGDVAFIASDLVGPAGAVIGADRAAAPLEVARRRAGDLGFENVTFVLGEPTEMTFDRPFDAVVGRYVLMYQADPTAWLRKLAANVLPGGVVAFQEPYRDGLRSFPPVPSYDRAWQLVDDTLRASGADPVMGIKLHAVFVAAGLPSPSMRLETLIAGRDHCEDHLHYEIDPVRVLLPEAERFGIATADEVGAETLVERAQGEIATSGSVVLCRGEVGVWARRP
jgi:SAM-dependent methyltransferase